MKTILITGGAGFIGSHLTEELAKKNKVFVVDNLSTGKHNNIMTKHFLNANVNKQYPLEFLFKTNKIDEIYHLAATVGVRRTIKHPEFVLRDTEGIMNILELARKYDVKKVLYSSSSEVYGSPVEIPESEDGHVNAKLPYAVVKLFGEKALQTYYEKYGLKTTSLRYFNVYGPRQESSQYGFVVGIFIQQTLSGKRPTIFGDGAQTRDFVYIKDNIDVAIKAMESKKTNGEIINIGYGRPITIYHLAERICRICKKKFNPRFLPERAYEIKHRFPDISKMMKLLDYRPKYSLDEGLKKTVRYYENNKKKTVRNNR